MDSPQKQDVTEEKGLEKKRVIESEGSGLKEAGGLELNSDSFLFIFHWSRYL